MPEGERRYNLIAEERLTYIQSKQQEHSRRNREDIAAWLRHQNKKPKNRSDRKQTNPRDLISPIISVQATNNQMDSENRQSSGQDSANTLVENI